MRASSPSAPAGPAGRPPSPIASLLDTAFKIRPGEARLATLMLLYLMAVVSTFIIGRTVRDTLFLHRVSLDTLPLMYVAVAGGVAFASWRYSFIADAYRRDRLIVGSLLLCCAVVCGFWGLVRFNAGAWVYFALYVSVEIIGAISIMQFWTLANDVFSGRQAKRLFGFIGAGAVVSNILCGFGIGAAAPFLGSEDLLLVAGLLFVAAIALVRAIAADAQRDLEMAVRGPQRGRMTMRAEGERILHSRHLQFIAAIVVVTFITVTIVDYQFKVLVRVSSEDEKALAAYFGYFYAFTGIVASTIQFVVTGRLLERSGIVVSLAVLPVALGFGVISILLVPAVSAIVAATVAKGAENVFRYTVNDATMQLLYVPVASHRRGRAKAFIDGIVKPASIAVSGVVLYLAGRYAVAEDLAFALAYFDLGALAIWIAFILRIRREYVRSLIDTLSEHRLDMTGRWAPVVDESTHRILQERLHSEDEQEVLTILDLLPSLNLNVHEELLRLLGHSSERIRIRSLELIGDSGQLEGADRIEALFRDPSPTVRSAAIRAFCAVGRERGTRAVSKFLHDADSEVRAAAVAAMITHGGLDGILTAAETLKRFLDSHRPEERLHGARVLGDIKVRNFFQPVLRLLQDDDPRVRIAAIEAAGQMRSPELVLALIYKLADPVAAMAAVRALVAHGPDVERTLFKVLQNTREDIRVRRRLPKILERVGSPSSFDGLLANLDTKDPELKAQIAQAAARIRERNPHLSVDERRLDAAVREQLKGAYQILNILLDLRLPSDHLLAEALHSRHKSHLALVFGLLEIRYPAQTIQLVRANLDTDNRAIRANALEIVDNVLGKEEARLLLPLLEDGFTLEAWVQKGREAFATERRPAEQWLERLVDDPHPWIVSCTLYHVADLRLTRFIARARGHLDSKDPIVRETAVWALDRLLTHDPSSVDLELKSHARRLTTDNVVEVRRAAEQLLSTLDLVPSPPR